MSDRYAVIGNPIGHTQSPLIHQLFALATGQTLSYTALLAPNDGFKEALNEFRSSGGCGMNVTVPFKIDAFANATEHSARALQAGAANALKFEGDRVLADNFDGVGLLRDVLNNLHCDMRGGRVLILGAGGATRGMVSVFLEQAPASLTVVDLTLPPAQAIAAQARSGIPVTACTYDNLFGGFDLVFNATSASLFGQLPPVKADVFVPGALAYDLVYGKGLTPFLALAAEAGASRLADGIGMLVEQAAEAFEWWRGVRPPTARVIEQLKVPLV